MTTGLYNNIQGFKAGLDTLNEKLFGESLYIGKTKAEVFKIMYDNRNLPKNDPEQINMSIRFGRVVEGKLKKGIQIDALITREILKAIAFENGHGSLTTAKVYGYDIFCRLHYLGNQFDPNWVNLEYDEEVLNLEKNRIEKQYASCTAKEKEIIRDSFDEVFQKIYMLPQAFGLQMEPEEALPHIQELFDGTPQMQNTGIHLEILGLKKKYNNLLRLLNKAFGLHMNINKNDVSLVGISGPYFFDCRTGFVKKLKLIQSVIK